MSIGDFLGAATPGIIACIIALSKLIDAKAMALQAQRQAQEASDKADSLQESVGHNADRLHELENGGTAAIVQDALARHGLIDRRHGTRGGNDDRAEKRDRRTRPNGTTAPSRPASNSHPARADGSRPRHTPPSGKRPQTGRRR